MNDQTKSLVRHILTALGFLLGALGIGDAAGAIEFVLADLDKIWDAILIIVTAVIGFFKDKERFAAKKETE
ncbi:MAG: hypothetical protein HRT87_04535 [Legionellales bacterium]|nr:hypothetical protein [Legionellales bacterium]